MMSAFLISLFLFSFFYLLRFLKSNKQNLPPSPPKLPLIGNLHQLGKPPHRSFQALSAKYGPIMLLHFGSIPTLVISSAETVKEILKSNQDVVFAGRPQTRATDALLNGYTGIVFSSYGEYWRKFKKIAVLELLSQKRVEEFRFVREEEVAKMVEKIRDSCQGGVAVNLSELILSVSSNVVSRSGLGRAFEQDKRLGELARKAVELLTAFSFKDVFPALGWMDYFTGLVSSLKNTSKALHEALDQVIEEHDVSMKDDDESYKKDIVDILLNLQKSGTLDLDLSRGNLKAILMDMLIAGTDTTAATMEWAMAELINNPPIMKKAQEEVRRVVGLKSKVTESDVNQMTYLKSVLKETLRFHAPGAMILRETSSGVKLGGYDIPPKTRVLINAWAIQRDPEVWDRPEEFIPERFSDISVDYKDQSGKFLPFGGGRRICPGTSFALAEAEFVIANLLYWFNWNAQTVDMTESNSFVIHLEKPLLVVPRIYSS